MIKHDIINYITTNENIKYNLTVSEHIDILKYISKLSNTELKDIINEQDDNIPKIPTPPNLVKKVLGTGIATAILVMPGGLAMRATIKYLKDDFNAKCELKCQRDRDVRNKALCAHGCKTNALKYIVARLEKEYTACNGTQNPGKCRKRLLPLIKEYKNKRNKSMIRLSYATKKAKYKGEL